MGKDILQKEDYVIAIQNIEDIEIRSVGIITNILDDIVTVFFIGKKREVTTDKSNIAFLDVKKTGKPNKVKICNICHVLKNDPEEFDVNQTDAKGRKTTRPSCKKCREIIDGMPLKREESKRLDYIKPKKLFTCPICGKISIPDITANLVKDHDHSTGNGRAWICDSCNTGLGRFKDDVNLIKKVIEYLESFS